MAQALPSLARRVNMPRKRGNKTVSNKPRKRGDDYHGEDCANFTDAHSLLSYLG